MNISIWSCHLYDYNKYYYDRTENYSLCSNLQIAWQTACGYLVLAVTYFDYVTSRRPPTCQDPFTNTNDVIFLLDVSSDVSGEAFSKYKSYVTEVIEKRIPEVNGTKRCACILFNEDNSDVIIDNLSRSKSGSNYTKVKDVADRIRSDYLSTSNSTTQIGILGEQPVIRITEWVLYPADQLILIWYPVPHGNDVMAEHCSGATGFISI